MASGPATSKRKLIRRSSSAALEKDSWKQPKKVEELVKALNLDPHPEGGYYKITWTSDRCSVIDYLMSAGSFSAWHRIRNSEEIWTHHGGDPVIIHTIQDGKYKRTVMGIERFSEVIPPGVWQAAEPVGENYSLVGCTCVPPFEFSNWEMPKRSELLKMFPEHGDVIECLTHHEEEEEETVDDTFY